MSLSPVVRRAGVKATLTVVATAALVSLPAVAQSERRAGDVLSAALPLGTLAVEWYRGDRDGAWQFAQTFGVATASTELLKRVTDVERPDRTNNLSFPSGHAARAFSSAAYVRQRHGFEAAAPLYLAALYVGHTRVAAQRHRWADVAGAALVAEVSARLLVQRASGPRLTVSADPALGYVAASLSLHW